jgi:hypothetical protein
VADLSAGWLRPDAETIEGIDLGRYQLGAVLGRGGFGTVHQAVDPVLGRHVAIKFVACSSLARDADVRTEAHALASVRHPNVVEVFDVGRCDDHLFIVMELVEGVPLSQWLARKPPLAEVLDVMLAAGRGLAAAHAAGITHCDFKPGNVLVGRAGVVKVVDFGLARWSTDAQEVTGADEPSDDASTRRGWGTPLYMAPEQHRREPIDARADVYAFALTLLEAVAGRRPLEVSGNAGLLAAKLSGGFVRPDEIPGLPRRIVKAIARGLAVDPRRRFANVGEMLEAIAPGGAWTRRVGIAAAIALAAFGLWPGDAPPRAPAESRTATTPASAPTEIFQLLADADVAFEDGDLDAAVQLGERAHELAVAQRHDDLAATAAAVTFRRTSDLRRDDGQSAAWRDRALAALASVEPDHPGWHDYDEGLFTLESLAGRPHAAWAAVLTMLLRAQANPIDGDHAWIAGLQFMGDLEGMGGNLDGLVDHGAIIVAHARQTFGNEHRDTASALLSAALWATWGGQHERSLAWLAEADAIYTALYPPDHVRRIHYDIVAGTALAEVGEHAAAFAAFAHARAVQEVWAPDSRGLAGQLDTSAGVIARRLGDLPLARELQYAGLVALEAEFSPTHPRITPALINLAYLERDAGDCTKARDYATRADDIVVASYAARHPYRDLIRPLLACGQPPPR